MNVKTEQVGGISIVRVGETRLMYPILSDFATAVSGLVAPGSSTRSSSISRRSPTSTAPPSAA